MERKTHSQLRSLDKRQAAPTTVKPTVHTVEVFTDSTERAVTFLSNTASRKYAVVTEGPPIYLWPPVPALSWRNPAFIAGWDFVNTLQERLPENKRSNYTLIDDLNYAPSGVVNTQDKIQELYRSSEPIQKSSLFAKPTVKNKIILESEIAKEQNSGVCSVLDASFNKQKIIDQLVVPHPLLHPVAIDKLMLVVVSPDAPEIKAEQLNMFQSLYEQLRTEPAYARVSKELTRKAITDTYFHVWISEKGRVSTISRPHFNSRFLFRELPF